MAHKWLSEDPIFTVTLNSELWHSIQPWQISTNTVAMWWRLLEQSPVHGADNFDNFPPHSQAP